MSPHNPAADFETAFDMVPWPALVLSCELSILACNRAYEQVVHLNRERMLGRALLEVFPDLDPWQAEALREALALVLKSRKPHHLPSLQYATPGSGKGGCDACSWTVSNIPLLGKDNTLLGILHCPANVTALTQLPQDHASLQGLDLDSATKAVLQRWMRDAQTIQAERGRLQQLFQQAPGFICVLQGPRHIFELANDAYYQLVGHREILGHPVAEVLPEVTPQGFLEKLDAVYATGVPFVGRAMPIALQRVAGGDLEQRYIDLIYQPVRDTEARVTGIFVQGSDVTEAYALAQEVAYQAAHDTLTGLYNRRELARQTQGIKGPGPHGLLYLDLDHFKIINDRCGHAAGDELLLQVTEALKAQCEGDDLLARLGGDEFALLRRNCRPEEAVELAERLRDAVHQIAFIWQGKRYGITVSSGVASFGATESLTSFETALPLADAACFLAKEKGRNRVQMSLATDGEVRQQQRHMDQVTRLKDALREERIVLYAQRMVGLQPDATEDQVFYEVLARLRAPDGTLVAPGGFIPAAERFGLIEEFDRHIVRKLFAHLQAQPPERRNEPCYFVNLSGMTLSALGFSDFIEASLAACPAVRASRICFEVTETAAILNLDRTAKAMRLLIDKGFRFALDDFGSGMASFVYLQRLPVQFVKIEGEFVKTISEQAASAIIVEAVTRVAHSMNMRTIAEAVEHDALLPRLRALGLDYAQGFGLHRPEPIERLLART